MKTFPARPILLSVALACVLVTGTACSSHQAAVPVARSITAPSASTKPANPKPSTPRPASTTVKVSSTGFTPSKVRIKVGTTVTWVFSGSTPRTVAAVNKRFKSPRLNNGQTYTMTFVAAGVVSYYSLNGSHKMTGTVTVTR
jgi:plastocyanin